MDLGAYVNIENLDKLVKENGINVPRLRGYRLMKDEEKINYEDLIQEIKANVYADALSSCPAFTPDAFCFEMSEKVKRRREKYGVFDETGSHGPFNVIDLKWNLIHGKARKRIKFALKKRMKECKKQYDVWNKYCGKDDVLYIHARIGGNNWIAYEGYKLEKESWFLEKVDDYFDNTYCDIYARIEVPVGKENENS